eukprot:TRINITY_DN13409_c0_g1_i1.p1 TRINITY_DN13409_c0_g1~~TRINITY_DN13409_c0_g1_i1.p1  ORF type:complete len:865 (+),score=360.95 TRINITY_DN13409_c0_g1_i1:354-2597(+)
MHACSRKVHAVVHNFRHNHGMKPKLVVKPPDLLRDMAAADVLGDAPRVVQGVVEDDASVYGVSLGGEAISIADLRTLCKNLEAADCEMKVLDLGSSLDVKGRPPLEKEEIDAEAERIAVQWGEFAPPPAEGDDPPEDEKTEKLKEAVASTGGEFTTHEDAFKHLAKVQLNRLDMLLTALQQNASLTKLDLSNNSIGTLLDGKKSFKQLRLAKAALDDHRGITDLCLRGNEMGPKGTGTILKGLNQNISVTALDVSENGLGDDEEEDADEDAENDDPAFGEALAGLDAVADLLKKNKFLRSLSLARNRIKEIELEEEPSETFGEDTGLYKVLQPLTKFHRLTTLDLSGNEFSAGGGYILGAALAKNKSVTSLNVSECALGAKGLEALCTHIAPANQLKTFRLRRNGFAGLKGKRNAKLTAKALTAFVGYLSGESAQAHLGCLDVAYNNMGPEASAMVLETLGGCTALREVDLSLNHLCGVSTSEYNGVGLKALGDLVQKRNIVSLHLKWNFLQPKGGEEFAAALAASKVTTLDVRHNHLMGDGLGALCKGCDNLNVLRAGSNGACGPAASEVGALMQRSPHLTMLDLSDNKIGTEGSLSVLGAVAESKLVALNLHKNMIGEAAAPDVAKAMKHLKTLQIGDNDFGSAAVVKHVIPAIRDCTVRTLEIWGGEGDPEESLKKAIDLFDEREGGDSGTLIELDLGVPLETLPSPQPADVPQSSPRNANNYAAKLLENLKAATFGSAAEVAL